MNAKNLLYIIAMGIAFTGADAAVEDISIVKSNLWVDGTNTFYPATNDYVEIRGRVTTPFLSKSGDTVLFIQDTTTGVRVRGFAPNFDLETNSAVFQPGVEVYAFGIMEQENGLRSMAVEFYDSSDPYSTYDDFYIVNDTPDPIIPEETTITNLLAHGEDYEGELIKITNLVTSATSWPYGSDSGFWASNGTDSIQIRLLSDTDVPGQLPPTNAFDIIGIASQFDTSDVPSNGYQILAFSYESFIQHDLGLETPEIVVDPSSTSVKVGHEVTVSVIGQDRNASDTLTITTNETTIDGATFTAVDSRVGEFKWTPQLLDAGNTYTSEFTVADGTYVVTGQTVITVAEAYPANYAWINEFHYDNEGTDADEGIELAGAAGIDLSEYDIVLYNGNGGGVDKTVNCTGTIDDEGSGYGAVWFAIPSIQNGSPDGIALVHDTYGLLDFISYEGSFTATAGAASGVDSFDVGVEESSPDYALGSSLQLAGSGTNYETFVWVGPMANTIGFINSPTQTIGGSIDANVALSNLATDPAIPGTNAFSIVCTITPNSEASSVSATAYYTLDDVITNSIGMGASGNDYTSSSMVPGLPDGTAIDYWVVCTFSGSGTNSPRYSTTNTYTVQEFAGFETFENYPETGSSYADGTFLGQDGSTWSYSGCSGNSAGSIDAESPLLGKSLTPAAYVESGTIAGGIGTLSFDIMQVYSTAYNLEVYVNDNLITNISGGTSGVIDSSGDIPVEVDGDFVLKFLQPSGAGQVSIDNVMWTAPDPSTPGLSITNPAQSTLLVDGATTEYTVQGSANTNVTGHISWTNALTGAAGTIAAAPSWSLDALSLDLGDNLITVSGSNSSSMVVSDSVTITRPESGPQTLPIFEDFEDQDWERWTAVSVTGDQIWYIGSYSGNYFAKMSGYSGGSNENEDWLISPPMDFTAQDYEVMEFISMRDYDGTELAVLVSTNYADFVGLPNSATWSALSPVLSTDAFESVESGILDLSSFDGTNVFVAFKYVSTTTASATYEIDDINIYNNSPNLPILVITNPASDSASVANAVDTYDVQGTANSNIVGDISWTNALTGGNGTLSAVASWSQNVTLDVGENVITVRGTNSTGDASTDSVSITRQAPTSGNQLLISEVADPASSYQSRFVEIYNPNGTNVDLAGENWHLVKQSNGGSYSSITLTGTISATGTYVVAYNLTNFQTSFGTDPDQVSGNISGNGDDAYILYRGGDQSSGTLIDIYGVIDQDGSGYDWEYTDSRAVRDNALTTPNTTWTASEWTITDGAALTEFTPGVHPDASGAADTDHDGIPDDWETLNFGTATGAVATADSDLDGVNNYDEYIADTQPTNSLSFFDNIITNMTGGNVIVLQAGPPTSDQRVYDAWYTTNLVAGSWTPYGLAVPGNGDGSAVILSVTNDVEGRFYRTGVRLP